MLKHDGRKEHLIKRVRDAKIEVMGWNKKMRTEFAYMINNVLVCKVAFATIMGVSPSTVNRYQAWVKSNPLDAPVPLHAAKVSPTVSTLERLLKEWHPLGSPDHDSGFGLTYTTRYGQEVDGDFGSFASRHGIAKENIEAMINRSTNHPDI